MNGWNRPGLDWLRALRHAGATPRRAAGHLAVGLGFGVPQSKRAVWISADDPRTFAAAGGLVRWLHRALPQHRLVVTTRRLDRLAHLGTLFPNDLILPEPFDDRGSIARFWDAVCPELLIWLGAPPAWSMATLRHLSLHPVPAAVLGAGESDVPTIPPICFDDRALRAALFIGVRDGSALRALRARGIDASGGAVTGDLRYAGGPAAPAAALDYLRRELGVAGFPVLAAEQVPETAQALVLDAFSRVRERWPDAALVWEPASPRDRGRLRALCAARSLEPTVRLLSGPGCLAGFAGALTAVIAGGSFGPDGTESESLVAAASCATPVVFGPHVRPGDDLAATFLAHEAAYSVATGDLAAALGGLLGGDRPDVGPNAQRLVAGQFGSEARSIEALRPRLPPSGDLRPIRQEWRMPSRVERMASTRLGQAILARCRRRAIRSWEALREHLGAPRTILCLGNGPSSEDPCLHGLAHDALFRVNCSWVGRPSFPHPDVVFVGDMDAVRRLPHCIFAFRNVEWESYQLFRRMMALRSWAPPFFTLERLPAPVPLDDWPARPTNGALMVLAAVMLQPDRLVIGGIDLFAHPDGRYPGHLVAPNAYAQVHDRDVDRHFIAACLRNYRGELVIVGDVLARALAEIKAAPAPQAVGTYRARIESGSAIVEKHQL
jgi:3-deoxy-D-manno-octulosonic-acid transferase